MTRPETERAVIALLREHAMAGSRRPVAPDALLGADGLGLDSLALVEFVVAFEKRFKVAVPDDVWAAASSLRLSYFVDLAHEASGLAPAEAPRRPGFAGAWIALGSTFLRLLSLFGLGRPR